jgi:hypothetical protein
MTTAPAGMRLLRLAQRSAKSRLKVRAPSRALKKLLARKRLPSKCIWLQKLSSSPKSARKRMKPSRSRPKKLSSSSARESLQSSDRRFKMKKLSAAQRSGTKRQTARKPRLQLRARKRRLKFRARKQKKLSSRSARESLQPSESRRVKMTKPSSPSPRSARKRSLKLTAPSRRKGDPPKGAGCGAAAGAEG